MAPPTTVSSAAAEDNQNAFSSASAAIPTAAAAAASPTRNDDSLPPRSSSISSTAARSAPFRPQDNSNNNNESSSGGGPEDWPDLVRRRRSSAGHRLAALAEIGGVNSIRSFTRSWQRAAGFTEVIPQRPEFVFAGDQEPVLGVGGAADIDVESYLYRGGGGSSSYNSPIGSWIGGTPPQLAALGGPGVGAGVGAGAAIDTDGGLDRTTGPLEDEDQQQRDQSAERKGLLDAGRGRAARAGSTSSLFSYPPALAAAVADSGGIGSGGGVGSPSGSYVSFRGSGNGNGYGYGYGTSVGSAAGLSYGAMGGSSGARGRYRQQATSMAEAGSLWRQSQQQGGHEQESEVVEAVSSSGGAGAGAVGERPPPILVKEVEEDGKIILTVEGQSTLPQTIFNSINVLIGVGLLSLPMGIRYAGWICGMATLFLAATVTAYTARLLAKCMDLDPVVITFSDLAFISFGPRARLVTSLLFTVELMAACVALIVLFADSLSLLFPGVLAVTSWKMLCCCIMVPLNFLPMRLLSVTSIIGIVCCFGIVTIVVVDGLTKKTSPGSLIMPATTYMFPANWVTLPLSFGLLMSPWGGHSVFPNIYRDMRHPYKYAQAVKVTFSFTYFLDVMTAVAGILMFGDDVKDEITANILSTSGYPRALTFLLCIFIAIIPLTKIPLNARPIIATAEVLAGLHQPPMADASSGQLFWRSFVRVAIRVVTILSFLVIAVLFPDFDSIMAFMGSALCFTICVTLPILFHLKLFGHSLSKQTKALECCILAVSIVASVVGTVWSFLPKSYLGL